MIFWMGFFVGVGLCCILAAIGLFVKVIPDLKFYERELEKRGYRF